MRAPAAAMLAGLAAAALAGCGVSTDSAGTTARGYTAPPATTPQTTATSPRGYTTPAPAPASATARPGACSLTAERFVQGGDEVCRRRGAEVHLVHKQDLLSTPTQLIRLLAVNDAAFFEGTARRHDARGLYVRVTLAVTNRTKRPRKVRPGMTALIVKGRQFEEAVRVERDDERSLLVRAGSGRTIPAGGSITGEVIFDVPATLEAKHVPRQAWLAIAGFTGGGPVGAIALGV